MIKHPPQSWPRLGSHTHYLVVIVGVCSCSEVLQLRSEMSHSPEASRRHPGSGDGPDFHLLSPSSEPGTVLASLSCLFFSPPSEAGMVCDSGDFITLLVPSGPSCQLHTTVGKVL